MPRFLSFLALGLLFAFGASATPTEMEKPLPTTARHLMQLMTRHQLAAKPFSFRETTPRGILYEAPLTEAGQNWCWQAHYKLFGRLPHLADMQERVSAGELTAEYSPVVISIDSPNLNEIRAFPLTMANCDISLYAADGHMVVRMAGAMSLTSLLNYLDGYGD